MIVIACVVSAVLTAEATTFATKRLETLAGYLQLQQLDTLRCGECYAYSFSQHALVIRVNRWNEIEHIGLKLFPQSMRSDNPLLYDFLERNLLERNIVPVDSEIGFMLAWDKFHFNVGTEATALAIDSTLDFYEERVDFRVYRCGWQKDGKKLLEVSFVMDYQMLSGCNLLELEENFVRDIRRHVFRVCTVPHPSFDNVDSLSTQHTLQGFTFLIPQINNDVYYRRTGEGWELINDSTMPSKTIPNMMLVPTDSLPMQLLVARYGFRTDTIETTYNQWFDMCGVSGSDVYFGMKGKNNGSYSGTVFILNHQGGFMQLLSVRIPEGMIGRPVGEYTITGRMYGFIPLHNINKQMLENIGYEKTTNEINEKQDASDAPFDDAYNSAGDGSDYRTEETDDLRHQEEP